MRGLIWTKHPGDLLGEAIDFLTHGDAQHFGFLRADGQTVHEAYLPRVRDRRLASGETKFIRRFRLAGADWRDDEAFEGAFDASLSHPEEYSILDLFKYQLSVPFPDDKSTICSVYGMSIIRKVCPTLLPLVRCEDCQVSPRDHLISPLWIEEDWP